MRKLFLCSLCLLCIGLLVSCGSAVQPDGTTVAAGAADSADGSFTLPADLSAITADVTMDDADVTCAPLVRDGKTIGFEMRFLQLSAREALLSDQNNMYYGVLRCGKKTIGVPMEQIRILTDGQTREFVLTLLLPSGETLSGKTCTVSFYVAARGRSDGTALLCVNKEIKLP